MGQAGSVPPTGNVDLDAIAKNAIVQTAVQGMIEATVRNATSDMVEQEKIRIRALEQRVEREIQTLQVTVSNLRQQKTTTEKEPLQIRKLEEAVEKLQTRVGAVELSIDTVKMIIPEAKALVELFLKQTNTMAEVTIQTRHVDNSSEAANATTSTSSSSTPAMSCRCACDHTHANSESTPSTAGGSSNPSFPHQSSPSAPGATFQTNGTLSSYESTPTSKTALSSARPNRALHPTTSSSPPALTIQANDTLPTYETTPTCSQAFSSARPNPALHPTTSSSPPALTIQANDTLPTHETTPTCSQAFSSAGPNPALHPTTSSSPPALTIQANDTLSIYETTSPSKTTFSSANRNLELPLTPGARPPLPPAFSGSRRPDSRLPSASFNESSPAGRNAQSASAHPPTAHSGTALSSTRVVLPKSRGKKSKPVLHKNKAAFSIKLHKAVKKGRVEVVRRLLEEKVNINAPGQEGMTAAHLAAMHGNAVILDLLLLAGVLVQQCDWYGWQPLHWAAKKDRTGRCVELLLEAGAPLDARTSRAGDTPLHLAALEGNAAAAAKLLLAGAKVGARNNDGETPLDLAPNEQMRRMLGAE